MKTKKIFALILIALSICIGETNSKILPNGTTVPLSPLQEKKKSEMNNIMMKALTGVMAKKMMGSMIKDKKTEDRDRSLRGNRIHYNEHKPNYNHKTNFRHPVTREESHYRGSRRIVQRKESRPQMHRKLVTSDEKENYFSLSDELQHAKAEDHLIREEKKEAKIIYNEEPEEESRELNTSADQIYLSAYPRIMVIATTISTLYNTYAEVIPEDIAQADLLEKTEQGLKTYKLGREFFNVIINESKEFQAEVDHFFENIPRLLVTLDEMMKVMAFESYYENVKSKVDIKEKQFVELDNQLKFETNDFVDKTRYFLVALDNLRNISNYLYIEIKPFQEKYMNDTVLNILDKIDQGVGMVDAILQVKIRMEGLMTNLTDGISKINVIRNNMAVILREMYKLIPVTSDSLGGIGMFPLAKFGLLFLLINLFITSED